MRNYHDFATDEERYRPSAAEVPTPPPAPAPTVPSPRTATTGYSGWTSPLTQSAPVPDPVPAVREQTASRLTTRPTGLRRLTSALFSRRRSPERHAHRPTAGQASLQGKVLSYQTRKRRKDLLHVLYDSVVNGAPMTFSPLCQVMTVELNDTDHQQIDANNRRSIVVNIVGSVYDGTIRPQDQVSVTGHWSRNGTINATRVQNLSNSSIIVTSHSIPAGAARFLTLGFLAVLALLIFSLCSGDPAPAATTPTMDLGAILGYILLFFLGIWLLSFPLRGIRRAMGRLGWILVGLLLVGAVVFFLPQLLYPLIALGLALFGLRYIFRSLF